MPMLYLVQRRPDGQTVLALRSFLELAEAGELVGVSASLMRLNGVEDHVCTGLYADRPAEAVRAALRASMILTRKVDEARGCP